MTTFSRIKLPSGLVLKAYSDGWELCEERTYATGKQAGETYDYNLGYYGSVYTLLEGAQEEEMRRSGASDLRGLQETLKRFRKDVSELLEVKVEVRVGK